MRDTRTLPLPALLWLLLSTPGCSTVIGIDENYTDLAAASAQPGGAAGSGPSGGAGPSAGRGGGSAQGGSGGAAANCSGAALGGVCWYLGSLGGSCVTTCSDHGGVAEDEASFVGTPAQGGSLRKCTDILKALNLNSAPDEATRADGKGLGCHLFGQMSYWLSRPDFDPSVQEPGARVVCGCLQ